MEDWGGKSLRLGRCSILKRKRSDYGESLRVCSSKLKRKRSEISYTQKRKKGEGNRRSSKIKSLQLGSLKLKRNKVVKRKRKKKNKQQQQQQPPPEEEIIPFKEGDIINIRKLLFTNHRDYLIKYDNHNNRLVKVRAEELEGKVIVVTFETLYDSWKSKLFHLIDIYNEIDHHKCPFEVVFVALTDDVEYRRFSPDAPQINPHQRFNDVLSSMPWTAIPYSDVTSRERIERSFDISAEYVPNSMVIDPTGLLLQYEANSLFSSYGPLGYPFSYKRLRILDSEIDGLIKQPSITKLLTTSQRSYVISNNGDKVPILSLENKVVALHFYELGRSGDLTEKLKIAYERLVKNQNFEVVLIYIPNPDGGTNEDSFWEIFKTMPWLAIPYKDPIYRNLMRFCYYPQDLEGPDPDPGCAIIGPRGEFFEPNGADILMNYGISAYPFTRKNALELEAEKAKKVKPEMLWDPNTVLRQKDGSKVPFSQVARKRIILLLGIDWTLRNTEFLTILESRYNQMKDTENEFEVIHIVDIEKLSDYNECAADVPWLVHPPFAEGSLQLKLLHSVFRTAGGLLAFDCDGDVVRKTMFPYFDGKKDTKFPFYDGVLEKELLSDFYHTFDQRYWEIDSYCKLEAWRFA